MALASPFFGKREHAHAPYSPNSGRNLNGTVRTEAVNNLTQTGLRSDATTPATPTTTGSAAGSESGSRLIVGPNIKLKGVEITGIIRYGKIIIEEGGQLSGDVLFGAKTTLLAGSAASPQKLGVPLAP